MKKLILDPATAPPAAKKRAPPRRTNHKVTSITRRMVKDRIASGHSQQKIADELGIPRVQLMRRYADLFEGYVAQPSACAVHIPTEQSRRYVEQMVMAGIKIDHIAETIGVTQPTLHKHYATEIKTARTKANVSVAMALYDKATNPSLSTATVNAALAWMRYRGGWHDKLIAASEDEIDKTPGVRQHLIGKKEIAAEAARTAGRNSEWGDDLHVGAEAIADDKVVSIRRNG